MSPMIFLALCAAFVAVLLFAEKVDREALKRVIKPAASLAFILAGLAAGALQSAFGQAVLTGLVLCALGDILLIPKSGGSFLAGMAAFAGGHAAYIAAFFIGGLALGVPALLAALAAASLGGGLAIWLWRDLGKFRGPVIGYSIIISLMVAASIAHWAFDPSQSSLQLAVAAAGFTISDIAVARDRFRKSEFLNRLWGLPLYYAAQCLFAISV